MNNKRINLLLLLLISFFSAAAQQDIITLEQKYPGELSVILKKHEEITIDFVKDSIVAKQVSITEILHLSEQSNIYSSSSVYHSLFSNLVSLEAWSIISENNKKPKQVKVNEFKEHNLDDNSIFHHDYKVKTFNFPGITKGTVTYMKYEKEFPEPRLLPSFYFSHGLPTEDFLLTIKVHKNIKLDYKLFNTQDIKIDFTTSQKGNYVTYQWQAQEQKSYRRESGTPEDSYFLPHIIYYITSVNRKGIDENVLATLDDLYNWNYNFIKEVVDVPLDEYAHIVDSLVDPDDTEIEKVKKLYAWVQEKIKYIAFSEGMRGYIPNHPEVILKNRYGDCKDMSTLLYTLLKTAGIQSHLTWIGTRNLPYSFSEIHTQHNLNHMIVSYITPEKIYYLDPTDRHGLFNFPASHIQGKEAMISINKDKYLVKKVEITEAAKNYAGDTVVFKISDKKLIGNGRLEITGYPKIFTTYVLTDKSKEKQDRSVREYLGKGGNKFLVHDYKIENLTNRNKNTSISYSCSIDDIVRQGNDELYINLNLDHIFNNDVIDEEIRKLPRENEFYFKTNFLFKLEIPEGYQVEFLPENKELQETDYGFSIKYSHNNNFIIYEKDIYMQWMLLYPQHFASWNNFVREISKAYRESLILKKI